MVTNEQQTTRRLARLDSTLVLRGAAALGVLVSAIVHFWLWTHGWDSISVIGPLFLLNAVAGVVITVAVLVWRHWLPLLAAVGFGAATLGAFIISATVGLFGVNETWTGTSQTVGWVSELLAIVAGGLALWRLRPTRHT